MAIAAVIVILSVQYSFKALDERSAILRWRPQILELDRVNIFEKYAYPNPPIMALLLRPLTRLSPLAMSLCWFYLKVAMAVVSVMLVFRLVETPERPLPGWARAAVVLLALRPIMGDLSHGNVNLFILLLVVLCLYAFHEGKDFLGGLSLALAISCKVTPALLLPYFAWKRAWKSLCGCALGLLLFLFVVPACFLGTARNVELLTSWYGTMVRPFVSEGEVTTDHINQSLPGLIYRLGSRKPSFYEKGVPEGYVNWMETDQRVLAWTMKGLLGVYALAVAWSCRTPTRSRAGWELAAEYSIVLVGMLLFSERTWKHHCVTLVLPFAVMVHQLADPFRGRTSKGILAGVLATALALMGLTIPIGPWSAAAKLAEAYGAYVWAFLLLLAGLTGLLRSAAIAITASAPAATSSRAA
jgi:hypothetical protein